MERYEQRKYAWLDDDDHGLLHIGVGATLEETVNILLMFKENGESVRCDFNDHMLYSDTVTMDGAFMQVLKHTKKEYDDYMNDYIDKLMNNR